MFGSHLAVQHISSPISLSVLLQWRPDQFQSTLSILALTNQTPIPSPLHFYPESESKPDPWTRSVRGNGNHGPGRNRPPHRRRAQHRSRHRRILYRSAKAIVSSQWPLLRDEAAVKLDSSHYFNSLRSPMDYAAGSGSDSDDEIEQVQKKGILNQEKHNDKL
ncbi:LOW QUALITY PROTEIN: hypothetical protein V2J09_002061 [Rumex salicifolius]